MFGRIWLFLGLLASGVALASDPVTDVGAAIATSIRWQHQWFGQSFGAACVKDRASRRVELTVFVPDGQTTPPGSGGGTRFAAYVEGSNVLYSGTLWPEKAIAEPSAGNPNACAPGEIAEQVRFSHLPGAVSKGLFVFSPTSAKAQIEPAQAARITAMVQRSLAYHYSKEKRALPSAFRLGQYQLSDPFLLASDSTGEHVFLLDFPPLSSIDDTTVVAVYSGDIFLGPDVTPEQRHRSKTRALSELHKRSTLIRKP